MDDNTVKRIAEANLPSNICALTGQPVEDVAVMHRDLSDWWPTTLLDMRDERICNLLIVDRAARDRYYDKLKNMGVVMAYSGGLDSTTVLHWCLKLFDHVHCLLFDYGQRHRVELDFAEEYVDNLKARDFDVSSKIIDMSSINVLASSALTRDKVDVPADTPIEEMGKEIPSTFVPGRNLYFMTALAQTAYSQGDRHIAMGVNILDYSGYPDCRPEFMEAMRKALAIGVFNASDLGVHAPLMFLDKKQIIRLGMNLGVQYENTHSCYNGVRGGCGTCDSCILRRKAFVDLGIEDPSISVHKCTG